MIITPKRKRLIYGEINLAKPGTKQAPETTEVTDELGKFLVDSGAAVEVTAKKPKPATNS